MRFHHQRDQGALTARPACCSLRRRRAGRPGNIAEQPLPCSPASAAPSSPWLRRRCCSCWSLRPRLTGAGGPARGLFPHWAVLDEDEIRAAMQDDTAPPAYGRCPSSRSPSSRVSRSPSTSVSPPWRCCCSRRSPPPVLCGSRRYPAPAWSGSVPRSASRLWRCSRSRTTWAPTTSTRRARRDPARAHRGHRPARRDHRRRRAAAHHRRTASEQLEPDCDGDASCPLQKPPTCSPTTPGA